MDEIDILVVFSLFIFRIGIPLVVTFSLAYLVERFMTNKPMSEADNTQTQEPSNLAPFFSPCWEVMECPAAKRITCQAPQRQGVPCWLTMQLLNGHLPDDCLDCPMFHHTHVSKEDIAV